MTAKKYFEKYKIIYGVSYKYSFGKWEYYCKIFHNFSNAKKWLNTEEYDFRTRELLSKTKLIEFIGKKEFNQLCKQ